MSNELTIEDMKEVVEDVLSDESTESILKELKTKDNELVYYFITKLILNDIPNVPIIKAHIAKNENLQRNYEIIRRELEKIEGQNEDEPQ